MTEPNQDPDRDSRIVAHIGHVLEEVHLEAIHRKRLRRERLRRNLKWMAIMLALSLLAAVFAMLVVYWGSVFRAYNPQHYEPKDQSRQQHLEQPERDRQKEGP